MAATIKLDTGAGDTPIHNAMQAMFLDPAMRSRTLAAVLETAPFTRGDAQLLLSYGFSVGAVQDVLQDVQQPTKVSFEPPCGSDVLISRFASADGSSIRAELRCYVECKPTVGEDFPAVLRQVTQQRSRLKYEGLRRMGCIAGRYVGNAVSIDDVKKMFKASGFFFLTLDALGASLPVLAASASEK